MKTALNAPHHRRRAAVRGALAAAALCALCQDRFLLTLFTRIVILAIAAVSLNLILGYGGMMSFGHAAYLGIGGYAVGILAFEGVPSASCSGRWRLPPPRCSRW